jgi:glycerophosphoryl diester phosphodiesterase
VSDPLHARLLSSTGVVVIAHRGGSKLRPENTVAAFDHAARLGVDGLECDVHLARDGELVVIHDATLERTTDASGPVGALTSAELAAVDAGYRFAQDGGHPYRGAGVGVPRLADVLARHAALPFVIEIKGDRRETAVRLLEVLESAGALERVLIGGFSDVVLDEIRRRAPDVPTSASRREVQSALRRALFWLAPSRPHYQLMQAPYRFRGRKVFGRSFVQAVRRRGLPVQAWIIDDAADMERLIGWGVSGLISDRPDVAIKVAKREVGRMG